MGDIHYEAVFPDGRFESSNSLPDLIQNGGYLFLVEKERGYSCNTYSHYKAIIIDESGTPAQAIVNGFSFNSFSIYGNAADYILYLPYYTPEGIFGSHEFKNDISYNHPLEGFSKIKPEWSIDSQYKVFFSFFESIAKYGKESYKRIIQLEREAYANDAAYRLEKHEFEGFLQILKRVVRRDERRPAYCPRIFRLVVRIDELVQPYVHMHVKYLVRKKIFKLFFVDASVVVSYLK